MKTTTILWVILFLLVAGAIFYAGRQSVDKYDSPVTEEQYNAALKQIEDSEIREDSLRARVEQDSVKLIALEAENRKIKENTQQQIVNIDVAISEDSSQAINQFRYQLSLLGVRPDNYEYASHRELGYTAKYLADYRGLKLEVVNYEEKELLYNSMIRDFNSIIKEKDEQLDGNRILLNLSKQATDYFQNKYEETQKLTYHRFGLYIGFGAGYDGATIKPVISAGVAIFIWRNEQSIFGL